MKVHSSQSWIGNLLTCGLDGGLYFFGIIIIIIIIITSNLLRAAKVNHIGESEARLVVANKRQAGNSES